MSLCGVFTQGSCRPWSAPLARSATVSVTAQNAGGLSAHPMGKVSGSPTIGSSPDRNGNSTAIHMASWGQSPTWQKPPSDMSVLDMHTGPKRGFAECDCCRMRCRALPSYMPEAARVARSPDSRQSGCGLRWFLGVGRIGSPRPAETRTGPGALSVDGLEAAPSVPCLSSPHIPRRVSLRSPLPNGGALAPGRPAAGARHAGQSWPL